MTQPLETLAVKRSTLFDYDTPPAYLIDNEDGEGVIAKTNNFGVIKTLSFKLLSPLEEKAAIGRAKGDPIALAWELALMSVAYAITTDNREQLITIGDGSQQLLANDLHPKLRSLAIQAYSDIATPSNAETAVFMRSRRVRV